jgi:AraC family ethanolamine operon transcriptional activator
MADTPNALQIRSSFKDFEAFAETIQGWGLDFQQLDCGHFKADLHQIITPNILISEAHFSRNLRQRGNPPKNMRTFVIMAEGATPFVWRRQEVDRNSFLIFPEGAELDASSLSGFHVYTLSVSEQKISERLYCEGLTVMPRLLKHGGVIEGDPVKVQSLRCFFENLTSATINNPDLLKKQEFQEHLSRELTAHVFAILSFGKERRMTLPFQKKIRLIQGIEAWLEETDYAQCSVQEICRTFQVNERTLRRVFAEWYGVPPKRYLLAIRLNCVRKELSESNSQVTQVSKIANRWGFWHMGQFAMIYRRQFGELPSGTLDR